MNDNDMKERMIEGHKFICEYTMTGTTINKIESIIGSPLKNKSNFCAVLESLANIWNDISIDIRKEIGIAMGGIRYQYYVPSMIESFTI